MAENKDDSASFRANILHQLNETLNQRRKLEENTDDSEIPPDNAIRESEKPLKEVDALDPVYRSLQNKDFEAEIALKKSYGKWFLIILSVQLLIMNGVFISVGWFELFYPDNLTLQLYMAGTMTEVFGLVFVVTKYLFKKR